MAVYGDSSTEYTTGLIPCGGIKIQPGCVTFLADATFYVPTTIETPISLIISENDGSCFVADFPCISSGNIKATMTNTGANIVLNYVAFGR